ncbi:unnamed protein product, partial [Pocillopora meandrina]
ILFKIKIQILFFFNKLQITFHYDSQFWSNRSTYNLPGGKTGFDLQETKLPTYWTTSFSKICLGTKINNQSDSLIGITANQENDCITCDSRIGLAQEVYMMTPTRVEMRQRSGQIMATGILKPWGTSWCYGRGHS